MRSPMVKARQRAKRRSLRGSGRRFASRGGARFVISSRIPKRIFDAAKQTVAGDDSKRHEAITCDILARIHLAIRDNIIWRSRPRGVVAGVSDRRAK